MKKLSFEQRPAPRTYATIIDDDGVNYRNIAETMSALGFNMNHSSARNYVLRVMRKFLVAIVEGWNLEMGDADIDAASRDPRCQNSLAEFLQVIEQRRRERLRLRR